MAGRVSAIVVNYNTADDLDRCLDHLQRQDEPLEVIVFDNGSADSSVARARRPGVRLFASPVNQGYSAATNQAAARASNPLLLLLNPDAFLPPDGARRLADLLEADESLAGVAPRLVGEDGEVQRTCRRLPRLLDLYFELFGLSRLFPRSGFFNRWKMGPFDYSRPEKVEQVYASCWLIRRRDFLELGGLDERFPIFFSDVELARRFAERGRYTLYYPEVRVVHRGGASVKKRRAKSIIESHRSFYRYLKKHGCRLNPLLWLGGLLLAVAAPLRLLGPMNL